MTSGCSRVKSKKKCMNISCVFRFIVSDECWTRLPTRISFLPPYLQVRFNRRDQLIYPPYAYVTMPSLLYVCTCMLPVSLYLYSTVQRDRRRRKCSAMRVVLAIVSTGCVSVSARQQQTMCHFHPKNTIKEFECWVLKEMQKTRHCVKSKDGNAGPLWWS